MALLTNIDPHDDRIAEYRDVRDADLRGGGGRAPKGQPSAKLCMVESAPVIRRMLDTSWASRVKSLLLSPDRAAEMGELLDILPSGVPVHVMSEDHIREISGYRHHGGALAAVHRPDDASLWVARLLAGLKDSPSCKLVLVEGVTHVDNIGTIFRNAAGFGVDAVLLDGCCADPLFRKAIRVSMGNVFRVPWGISHDWQHDLKLMKEDLGMTLIGAESMAAAVPLAEVSPSDRTGIIFGSERNGLSGETLAICDQVCQIPMAMGVPSLNVGVASAVVLYELSRYQGPSLYDSGL